MQRNTQQLREDIGRILAGMDSTGQDGIDADEEREPDTAIPYAAQEEPGTVHVHEFTDSYVLDLPDRLIVFPKQEPLDEEEGVIDTTLAGAPAPQPPQRKEYRGSWLAYAPVSVVLLLVCFSFLHVLLFPPLAHITLILKSQEVSVTTTLQTGRILAPLTLSQSASVPATGRGHQDPKQATGAITFYNGLFSAQTVSAGTTLTGSNGVQVVTDQDAVIPAASPNPPVFGQVTVSAQATSTGSRGNISAYDINETCCANGILAKNTDAFSGGQDERDFQFVTKTDVANAATPLEAALTQSVTAALQTQLKDNEQLETLPCAPQVSTDHQINEEATSVKVTATLTCSGVTYNQTTLQQQATQLLSTQAFKKLGPGYSVYGAIQVSVTHAIPTHTTPTLVLSLSGTWTYALSSRQQQRIKDLVKGKTYQEALHILRSLPGIERASLAWDEHTKLPEDPKDIHLLLISGI